MDITPFALTPEHKGRLASLLNETGQPAAMLIPAIVKALEELQRRNVSGGTPDREAHVHASAPPRKKSFGHIAEELFGDLPDEKSMTSGKAGGLQKVEPLKADRGCEPLKAVRL